MNYALGPRLADLVQLARDYQKRKETWAPIIDYPALIQAIHNEVDKEFNAKL